LESCETEKQTEAFVTGILSRFITLRDASRIPLARINRFSVEQYRLLLEEMVSTRSGGLFPLLAVVALYRALVGKYAQECDVDYQGINVADSATGAKGDVTIREGNRILLAIEVTERAIDQWRVVSTYNSKIALEGINAYLFVYTNVKPDESARQVAKTLFSQGYDVKFVNLVDMAINAFLMTTADVRESFSFNMLELLDAKEVPGTLKISWNEAVKRISLQ
jgi:hypothetical protein